MSEVETLGLVDEEEDGWMKWKTLQLVDEKEEGCKRKLSRYWMKRGWMDATETYQVFDEKRMPGCNCRSLMKRGWMAVCNGNPPALG
jgi:hypothetical protein